MPARPKEYLQSLAVLAVAILLRRALDPVLGPDLALVTLFGAVASPSGWAGIVQLSSSPSSATSRPTCSFMEPRGGFNSPARDLVGLIAYLFTCSLIVGFGKRCAEPRPGPTSAGRSCGSRCRASVTRSSPPTSRAGSPHSTPSRRR